MHATDFWVMDARKVWGKSRMRATYIPDARNPSNHQIFESWTLEHRQARNQILASQQSER